MPWLAIITGFIKLASAIAQYAKDRQLINAGVAEAVAAGNSATLSNIDKAKAVKDEIANRPDSDWSKRVHDRSTKG